ncbi:MAG: cupin domain-containing protein [Candidatus Bathyarchaeia archaeon]
MSEMDVIGLRKHVEYSRNKGLLDIMEKRRRVKKDLLKTRNYNIVLACLDAGQEIPSRPEPYDVCFYVVEGSGTFTVGNEKAELSSGQMVFAERAWAVFASSLNRPPYSLPRNTYPEKVPLLVLNLGHFAAPRTVLLVRHYTH